MGNNSRRKRKRRIKMSMEIGYIKQEWHEDENGITHITKALLVECSLVRGLTNSMYSDSLSVFLGAKLNTDNFLTTGKKG